MAQATVWLLDTAGIDAQTLARWSARLGESERTRLERFRRAVRRRQFVAGRMLLRHALALQPGGTHAITVTERPGQAPLVMSNNGVLPCFSLSHSGPWVACAVGAGTAVGVDVEVRDAARDAVALATQAFSAADARAVAALNGLQRLSFFYQLWCRYEAHYKLGGGDGYPYRLPHEGVEIALSCAQPLDEAPQLRLVMPAALS